MKYNIYDGHNLNFPLPPPLREQYVKYTYIL